MKSLRLVFYTLIVFLIEIGSAEAQNVKLLDLSSSSTSFYVPIGSQMQVTSIWTFEAWLYVDSRSSGTFPVIMDRKTVFSFYLIDGASGGDYAVRFVARNSSDNIIASLRCDGNESSTATPMSFDTWYHVAVSRDGTTARMFIDGDEVHSSIDNDFVLSTPTGNTVNYGARYWNGYGRYLDGALDEIRYSDICRYDSDFTISKTSPPHPTSNDNNTILLFNFDNSDLTNSTTANDYTATSGDVLTYTNWNGLSDDLPLSSTLPLSYIIPFSGRVSKSSIILSWEVENSFEQFDFEIQRSRELQDWETIAYIKGNKRSDESGLYQFIDKMPQSINYYRLKQWDQNGNYYYSKVILIHLGEEKPYSIYPNPVKDHLYISNASITDPVSYTLYNQFGAILGSGLCAGKIDTHFLEPGIYFVHIETKGQSITDKFILN